MNDAIPQTAQLAPTAQPQASTPATAEASPATVSSTTPAATSPAGTASESVADLDAVISVLQFADLPGDQVIDKALGVLTKLRQLDTPSNEAALRTVLDTLSKPGYKSSEVWIAGILGLSSLALTACHLIPGETGVAAAAILAMLIIVERAILKALSASHAQFCANNSAASQAKA